MFILSKLSENLAELMAEREFNQTALANAANMRRSKISNYLCGIRAPDYDSFVALIEFFNCSADFLIGLKDYPEENVTYQPVQPFNLRLRTVLHELKVTQYALQKGTGLSWSVLHNWLTGKSLPSMANIVKLVKFLDCSVDHLLGRN